MSPCLACKRAESAPRIDEFTAHCESCKARALAVTGAHLASKTAGKMTTDYLSALKAMFGQEWEPGALQVRAWGETLHRAAAKIA